MRIGSVGVCGSDIHYYDHGRIGPYVVERPLVLGHEAGGEVVRLGPDVARLEQGQRVSIEPGVPCRSCAQCLGGRYNLCPDVRFFATPPYDGAFCEYVVMPESFVHPVPDNISDDAAGLIEPLSVGIWACRRGEVAPGSQVLITGAGPIGLVCLQAALAYGAADVVVSDVNAHRLALATKLGATSVVDVSKVALPSTGVEPDVLLECSGNGRATTDAVRTVARAGRVVLIGMGGDEADPSVVLCPGSRAGHHRGVPLRQHVADGDLAGGVGTRQPRLPGHWSLRARRGRKGPHGISARPVDDKTDGAPGAVNARPRCPQTSSGTGSPPVTSPPLPGSATPGDRARSRR